MKTVIQNLQRFFTHNDAETGFYRTLFQSEPSEQGKLSPITILGLVFFAVLMMPGALYLGLMSGYGFDTAASWASVVIFLELFRRSFQGLSRGQIVLLLYAAHIVLVTYWLSPGGPVGELVFRAFLISSDFMAELGIAQKIPGWFAPGAESAAVQTRTLLHADWVLPLAVVAIVMLVSFVEKYTLGYFFYRVISDLEKLPFPLASVEVQGSKAIWESHSEKRSSQQAIPPVHDRRQKGRNTWKLFTIGAYIGIGFSAISTGVPVITDFLFGKPLYVVAQPFVDLTSLTQGFFPATPLGVQLDVGIILLGMVLPFWVVVGTCAALLLTVLLNPLLHKVGVLQSWQTGMDTVATTYANNVDFWFSVCAGFAIGVGIITCISLLKSAVPVLRGFGEGKLIDGCRFFLKQRNEAQSPGYPLWVALACYVILATGMVVGCVVLIPALSAHLLFLLFVIFLYNPFVSFIHARLLAISGQKHTIPFITEAGPHILFHSKQLVQFLLPLRQVHLGMQTQQFRISQLCGVRFTHMLKTDLIALPLLFAFSVVFWAFIWKADPIVSSTFPAAQVSWQLKAQNRLLLYSAAVEQPGEVAVGTTHDEEPSIFSQAIHGKIIAATSIGAMALWAVTSLVNIPILFFYGFIRGLGQVPHFFILEILGALIARFYLYKKFGKRQVVYQVPAVFAGYITGVGIVGLCILALKVIQSAVQTPFY